MTLLIIIIVCATIVQKKKNNEVVNFKKIDHFYQLQSMGFPLIRSFQLKNLKINQQIIF